MVNPYLLIMSISGIIILSFFFNILAKKTNIPSVLMLIALGMGLKVILDSNGLSRDLKFDSLLEILGNIGLVMIVLEASINLKLEKEKKGLILKSLLVSVVGLGGSILGLSAFFLYIFPSTDLFTAACYAIPLSMISSAIMIPKVGRLTGAKKEFMIYESKFTHILGIIIFYFMIGADGGAGDGNFLLEILINIAATAILSIVGALGLVYLIPRVQMSMKLLIVIMVIALLFALGKYFHLSSLLIILAFGVLLYNADVLFKDRYSKFFDKEKVMPILNYFETLTSASAHLIRSFFFVLLGLTITLNSFYNWPVFVNSLVIVIIIFLVRFIALRIFAKDHLFPELFTAPRGVITILLFFVLSQNESFHIQAFDAGLILYPLLISSMIMMISLISYRGDKIKDVLFPSSPWGKTNTSEEINARIEENTEKQDFDGF